MTILSLYPEKVVVFIQKQNPDLYHLLLKYPMGNYVF